MHKADTSLNCRPDVTLNRTRRSSDSGAADGYSVSWSRGAGAPSESDIVIRTGVALTVFPVQLHQNEAMIHVHLSLVAAAAIPCLLTVLQLPQIPAPLMLSHSLARHGYLCIKGHIFCIIMPETLKCTLETTLSGRHRYSCE